MSKIHITTKSGEQSAYEEQRLKTMLEQGLMERTTLVWKEGMSRWVPISDFFETTQILLNLIQLESSEDRIIYTLENDKKQGPYSLARIRKMVDLGTVAPDTLAWTKGMANWIPLNTIQFPAKDTMTGVCLKIPPPCISDPEAPISERTSEKLEGLGGWLILVGIGVVLSPIRLLVVDLPIFAPIFTDGTWEMLTTVGSDAYHPLWGPLIIGELAFYLAIFVVSCYQIYLFFCEHYFFPRVFIAIIIVSLVFGPLDAWLVSQILPGEPMFDPATIREFSGPLITGFIWIPYMLISKRVRATFGKKVPDQPMEPISGGVI